MIQNEMTERAVELLALPDNGTPKLLLDLGCGSGLSGAVLSRHDHYWVGMDISRSMLGNFYLLIIMFSNVDVFRCGTATVTGI